jgi:orotate phosphoribosyltransferase
MLKMKKELVQDLLKISAVALQPEDPFIWSSGIQSPIYCDNRLTLSYPAIRQKIAKGLAELIQKEFAEVSLIAGTATAGIPHAAWVSDVLNLPMCYVRSKAKEHGKGKQIEGKADKGMKVVVVEDLISTGGSSIQAIRALQENGCEVLGVVAIFTYGLQVAEEKFGELKVPYHTLTDYETLLEEAVESGQIKEEDLGNLKRWRENPAEWTI